MTDEKGVYVRHIEQSIDVTIRTHPINQLKRKCLALQHTWVEWAEGIEPQRIAMAPPNGVATVTASATRDKVQ